MVDKLHKNILITIWKALNLNLLSAVTTLFMMTIQRPLYFYVVEVDLSPDIFSFDYGRVGHSLRYPFPFSRCDGARYLCHPSVALSCAPNYIRNYQWLGFDFWFMFSCISAISWISSRDVYFSRSSICIFFVISSSVIRSWDSLSDITSNVDLLQFWNIEENFRSRF